MSGTEFIFGYRPRKINPQDANKLETLVPIRIEFDVEHHKMRDTFVWNINGTSSHRLPEKARLIPFQTPL